MQQEHSPLPWKLQDDGLGIYDPQHDSVIARFDGFGPMSGIPEEVARGNAALALRAVNSHAALVDALDRLQGRVNAMAGAMESRGLGGWPTEWLYGDPDDADSVLDAARAALALARGEHEPVTR